MLTKEKLATIPKNIKQKAFFAWLKDFDTMKSICMFDMDIYNAHSKATSSHQEMGKAFKFLVELMSNLKVNKLNKQDICHTTTPNGIIMLTILGKKITDIYSEFYEEKYINTELQNLYQQKGGNQYDR